MQTTLQGIVTGISKYEIEGGAKGASLFMIQKTSGRNPNIIGQETLKLKLPYEMFEDLRQYDRQFNEFAIFQVDADVEAGGAGRPAITAIAIRPINIVIEETAAPEPVKPEPTKPGTKTPPKT